MAEYDLDLAHRLAQMAAHCLTHGFDDPASHRAAAYMSRLSMELSLKAFLESAGMPIPDIRAHSHKLKDLLEELDQCEVEIEIAPGVKHWLPASRLRAVVVPISGYQATAGLILEAEDHGASRYPAELRYGGQPRDFQADALASAATTIADWVGEHRSAARMRSRS